MKKLSIIKFYLFEKGMRQRELSRISQIPEVKLSEIIRGRCEPSENEKKAISRALDVPVKVLFAKELNLELCTK